jgi:hypothetical protein
MRISRILISKGVMFLESLFISILECIEGVFDIKGVLTNKSSKVGKVLGITLVLIITGILVFCNYL